MRKKLLGLVLIGAIALLFSLSTPVAAGGPPIQPMAFWGHVTVDGLPSPGSTVSAHIGALSWTTPVDGSSNYGYSPLFKIPYDDPETPAKDGGIDGDTIIFKVDGVPAIETYTYELGKGVKLDLHVGAPPEEPLIGFSPTSFTFSAIQGGANPPNQTLQVWNAGGGTLNWSVSEVAAWLSLSPTSGSSTGETDNVTVSVNITGMTTGSYPATITIAAPGATNTPQTVGVTLNISPPAAPYIGFSPASLTFSATEGGSNPSNKTLDVWNAGGSTLNWSVSDDAAWLGLSPTSGSSTGEHDTVTVSVDITGMMHAYSPYVATITITGNADNSPQYVGVTVNIRAPGPPPVGGTGYIPSKPSILWPWIGLSALAVGVGIFAWRRRRARQRSIG